VSSFYLYEQQLAAALPAAAGSKTTTKLSLSLCSNGFKSLKKILPPSFET